jgi:hypothetical protein
MLARNNGAIEKMPKTNDIDHMFYKQLLSNVDASSEALGQKSRLLTFDK